MVKPKAKERTENFRVHDQVPACALLARVDGVTLIDGESNWQPADCAGAGSSYRSAPSIFPSSRCISRIDAKFFSVSKMIAGLLVLILSATVPIAFLPTSMAWPEVVYLIFCPSVVPNHPQKKRGDFGWGAVFKTPTAEFSTGRGEAATQSTAAPCFFRRSIV